MDKLLAAVRGSTYEGLALAFSPPAEEFYRYLKDRLLRPLKDLGSTFAWVSFKKADVLAGLIGKEPYEDLDKRLISLKAEYHRLFVGPYRLPAPPYASVYLESEPTIMGLSTLEVLRMYAEAGLLVSPSFKDLPDHITAELQFMALLCKEESAAWQRNNLSQAAELLRQEETFLRKHLVQWIPRFSSRILCSTESPFYRALGSLLQDYVLLDVDCVGALRRFLKVETSVAPIKEETKSGA